MVWQMLALMCFVVHSAICKLQADIKRHTLIMLCILIFFLIQRVQGFEFDQSYATPCKVLTIGKEAAVLGADQVSCNQMR